jgi:Thioesterase-like superfamily
VELPLGLVADSYFVPVAETATTGRYHANPTTVGPWSAQLQHGGPPNALAVAAAERAVRAETGRDDLIAMRLAADFVGPVPVAEIETRVRVVRAARSAALVHVVLSAAGRDCLEVRVWFVRIVDTTSVAAPASDPGPVAGDENALDTSFGYGRSLDSRFVRGRMHEPGPATAWIRPRPVLYAGYDYSGLARVAVVADSASGISAELDWATWSFLNVDLDIHLARPFVGDWVLMEAMTQIGPQGSGLARSTLSDERGPVGSGLQTLVVGPMSR